MATINLVLDLRRARKDGTYPLVFRIRIGKKFSDIASGFTIRKEDFDLKTSSIKDDLDYNVQLNELKSHYTKRLRTYLVSSVGNESVKDARSYLIKSDQSKVTIAAFWGEHIEELKVAGRHGGARNYQTALSVLSTEADLNIPFSSFNLMGLKKLEKCLYQRGLSTNGIAVYFRSLRAICNKAIDYDLVGYEWYPFRKHKIKKDKTSPRVLSLEEIGRYFALDLPEVHPLHSSWLIGKLIFMLRGINITDLLLLSSKNIKGDRVIYKRAKTGKIYSIAITVEMKDGLTHFAQGTTLLGVLKEDDLHDKNKLVNILMQKRKVINAHLKKLGELAQCSEPITTYVFRYTYSNVAKRLGYSKDLIAEALGHEYGNSVTGIYLEQFDMEVVDEMNTTIIRKVWGG